MFCDFITDAELSRFKRIYFSVKILFYKKCSKFDLISDGSIWNILFCRRQQKLRKVCLFVNCSLCRNVWEKNCWNSKIIAHCAISYPVSNIFNIFVKCFSFTINLWVLFTVIATAFYSIMIKYQFYVHIWIWRTRKILLSTNLFTF